MAAMEMQPQLQDKPHLSMLVVVVAVMSTEALLVRADQVAVAMVEAHQITLCWNN
jgi:hypothetical protein